MSHMQYIQHNLEIKNKRASLNSALSPLTKLWNTTPKKDAYLSCMKCLVINTLPIGSGFKRISLHIVSAQLGQWYSYSTEKDNCCSACCHTPWDDLWQYLFFNLYICAHACKCTKHWTYRFQKHECMDRMYSHSYQELGDYSMMPQICQLLPS